MTAALRRCRGTELDAAMLYELLKLRVEVFVVEQNCPYPELDGRDLLGETRHFWLANSAGDVTSTLRLMEEFDDGRTVFRIGRVATMKTERGRGHSTRLMQAALAEVGDDRCVISAQSHLAQMYARHGFIPDGAEFVEDGIPHVPMLRAARR
ncbi:MAG: GNAT family N-acetyltransferase [Mycobacterium sp.]|nr:GNAT family N-acetyltransferase [Mycobacterium sp.]MCX6481058.1 GNAT family N-acetyltransferase [Mycobacterium sp.]